MALSGANLQGVPFTYFYIYSLLRRHRSTYDVGPKQPTVTVTTVTQGWLCLPVSSISKRRWGRQEQWRREEEGKSKAEEFLHRPVQCLVNKGQQVWLFRFILTMANGEGFPVCIIKLLSQLTWDVRAMGLNHQGLCFLLTDVYSLFQGQRVVCARHQFRKACGCQ